MFFLLMTCRYEKEGSKAKKMQKIAKIWKRKILASGPAQDAISVQPALNAKTRTGAKQEEVC